ncbi:MAG: VOC family protein [Phenylobacterium sp.]|uniref:VOC family protein n=1 Tax=Phenylobacterium sp. TaxID=1871053 RepID=UPI00273541C9|nr:VOC family protein [Phenylobacterium sp.]MDP3175326.1 VOC family protein [Phenylobacterium sp.]
MSVQLNHTIVWCSDKHRSSAFLAQMLGRPDPVAFYHFMVVEMDNSVSLDFYQQDEAVTVQHYAFLTSEAEFDGVFARIEARGLEYWADPARTRSGEINRNDDGRGVYFLDPDGHVLEVITRPYGAPG